MLDFDLDIRGANFFVRPFHAAGLLVTILIATFAFAALLRLCRSVLAFRPASQTLLYVVSVLTVWTFFLPLGGLGGRAVGAITEDSRSGWRYGIRLVLLGRFRYGR
jgi:hypothetical protein